MNGVTKSTLAGAAGAITTTLLHQLTRGLTPDAPRVDLLGMQAVAAGLKAVGIRPPIGDPLYNLALLGDLVSNTAYFGLVGSGPGDRGAAARVSLGTGLGVAAGLGAVYLPPRIGLSGPPTRRTGTTRALTVMLYTAGGLAAALVYGALPD